MRPTLYGNNHAVSAGHYLAAAAGFAILEAGGNAIDAGCCAGMALAVLHPDEVNFAGVAPIMIRTGAGDVVTIAGLGHWPRSLPPDIFMREHNGEIPLGVLRTVVPAAPDAWITALRDYGTMSFAEVAAGAIEFARDGFSVFAYFADELEAHAQDYAKFPSNAAIFLPGGKPPRLGERFLQTDLAATIQFMADEERAALAKGDRNAGLEAARAAFYVGDIAERIASFHGDNGSYLTREDLTDFRCRYEPAVRRTWRDMEVITCGPWCQGPTLIQALLMVEQAGLDGLDHNSGDYLHLLMEVIKCVFSDREFTYGDPQFVDVPLDTLMSSQHISERLKQIDRKTAMPDMPPPLVGEARLPEPSGGSPLRDPDTSYLCAVDRWGNAFSATPSDASWRSPVIPGLGIVPSARGTQSRPDPSHPSGVAPGKRPRLTPNPAIVVRDDGAVMPFGAPGGDSQVQAMLQVFLNTFHFGMDVQEAIDAPRVCSFSFPSSFAPYRHYPGLVGAEARIPSAVLGDLEGRGHKLDMYPDYTRVMCAVEAILAEPAPGFLRAGADPRQPAYAVLK